MSSDTTDCPTLPYRVIEFVDSCQTPKQVTYIESLKGLNRYLMNSQHKQLPDLNRPACDAHLLSWEGAFHAEQSCWRFFEGCCRDPCVEASQCRPRADHRNTQGGNVFLRAGERPALTALTTAQL